MSEQIDVNAVDNGRWLVSIGGATAAIFDTQDRAVACAGMLRACAGVDIFGGAISIVPTGGLGWGFTITVNGVLLPFPTLDDAVGYIESRKRHFTPEDRSRLADEIETAVADIEFAADGFDRAVVDRALQSIRANNPRN